ncbi:hypothetical protein KAM472_39660 [Aeromonas caviae]|nr:hypothetical protein C6B42_14640 [Aeromonas caviae]GKR04193.1 hypothetical protein KAM462_39130 [Aeromonas caviae]GKR11759.1 hypothetical protein KAM465_33360 [Aeromonas caviae]GKR15972.1 hypothetical protein KAM466_32900 [Aeromonas caviae]GKR20082.1 hypothetical protein KAM467_31260 [Aeromonas caviae]
MGKPSRARTVREDGKTIAAFIRSAKRRQSANMRQAIADWEADLAWLKQHYYVTHELAMARDISMTQRP